eukprot:4683323-Prymnesium_polylepis.1
MAGLPWQRALEGDVPILTDADARQLHVISSEELRVRVGIGGIEIVDGLAERRQLREETLAE